jgi:hypothetical protein
MIGYRALDRNPEVAATTQSLPKDQGRLAWAQFWLIRADRRNPTPALADRAAGPLRVKTVGKGVRFHAA